MTTHTRSKQSSKGKQKRSTSARKKSTSERPRKSKGKKWSGKVTAASNAMDLEENIFKSNSAKHIASSVKKSAERSKRRKGTALQSAMSMLNFYENRAGKNLSSTRKETIDRAKGELRKLFGKEGSKQQMRSTKRN
jgi:hypothetical protein